MKNIEVGDWVMLESEDGDRVDGPVVWVDRAWDSAAGLQLQGHMLPGDNALFKTFWVADGEPADGFLARWTVVGHASDARVHGGTREDLAKKLDKISRDLHDVAALLKAL